MYVIWDIRGGWWMESGYCDEWIVPTFRNKTALNRARTELGLTYSGWQKDYEIRKVKLVEDK